jgi:hypothetical protein
MKGLSDLLGSAAGAQMISGMARETGQPEDKTADVLSMAMPLLLGAMKKNASSPQGAEGLIQALSSRHTGGILEDMGGLFNGGVDESIKSDGAGILGHVLGNRQPAVESALSQQTGIDAGTIAQILKIGAPILLGFLGQQRARANVSDAGGLNSLLGSLLGGQPSQNRDLITSLIDSDGDGSVLDDVSDMIFGRESTKKGGLNDILGDLLG